MRVKRPAIVSLAAAVCALMLAGPAWAHGGEEGVPAEESFATAMALLQVQPGMVDLIADKIADGLGSEDAEGIDLDLARGAQEAFEAGSGAEALNLLSQATGLTPADALALQTEDITTNNDVPLADQVALSGSASRPSTGATVVLAVGAVLAIGLGVMFARRTR